MINHAHDGGRQMTERQRHIDTLAWFTHAAGSRTPQEIRMTASELMDLHAKCSYIGDWYVAHIECRSSRVESRFWNDIQRKVEIHNAEHDQLEQYRARVAARS
jgi:hypothetical protein